MVQPLVLVVDDDEELREVLRDVLEEAGYRVEEAHDGDSALEQLRALEPKPSMVLLDQAMPGLDGNGVLEALQRESALASVPVLVMTGLGRTSVTSLAGTCVHANVRGFLQKPLRLSDVLTALHRAS